MGNYNPKKSTPCLVECMRALKWIPVLFIGAVIIWSYYAYVVQLCVFSIENIFEKIVFLIFYHLICILFFWSYWSTVFTPIGTIPSKWRIPESEVDVLFRAENQEQQKRILEHCARDLPITNRTVNGSVRFCEKCKIIKPDRAHHCSVCGTCVLKMDHHCPWVNNCVNFKNYKCFVLFLGYGLLYCLYVALTTIEYFVRFWRGELNDGMGRFNILFLFFVSLMFAISLVSLFGYHVYLVLMNRTTLEAFRAPIFRVGGPDKNGFNLGKYANFQEVFGDNWKLWLLPVFSSMGDGIVYTVQPQHQSSTYNSMGDTQTHRLDAQPTDKLITLNETSLNNPHPRHEQRLASNPLSTRIQIENHVETNKKPGDLITAATINVAEQKRQKHQQQPGAAGATSSPTKATSVAVAPSAAASPSNSPAVTMNHDGNVIIDMNNTDQQQHAAGASATPTNPKT